VGGLLAAHEHGAKGGAHARAAVQLSHLRGVQSTPSEESQERCLTRHATG
jgi:hypothetical protein